MLYNMRSRRDSLIEHSNNYFTYYEALSFDKRVLTFRSSTSKLFASEIFFLSVSGFCSEGYLFHQLGLRPTPIEIETQLQFLVILRN